MKKQLVKRLPRNNFRIITKRASDKMKYNSPTILVGIGIAGLISTTILAVKATPKAVRILEDDLSKVEFQDYRDRNLPLTTFFSKKEMIEKTWKCYIPSVLMGCVTTAAIITSNNINLKRNAAIAGMYTLAEKTLKEYQTQVVQTVGANKAQSIKDAVTQKVINENPIGNKEVIVTGQGEMLCYDSISGRYFRSDVEQLRRIQNDFNHNLIRDSWVTLNELYYAMGLNSIKMGEDMGWHPDNLIEFNFSTMLADNGGPCLVVDHDNLPTQHKSNHYH